MERYTLWNISLGNMRGIRVREIRLAMVHFIRQSYINAGETQNPFPVENVQPSIISNSLPIPNPLLRLPPHLRTMHSSAISIVFHARLLPPQATDSPNPKTHQMPRVPLNPNKPPINLRSNIRTRKAPPILHDPKQGNVAHSLTSSEKYILQLRHTLQPSQRMDEPSLRNNKPNHQTKQHPSSSPWPLSTPTTHRKSLARRRYHGQK